MVEQMLKAIGCGTGRRAARRQTAVTARVPGCPGAQVRDGELIGQGCSCSANLMFKRETVTANEGLLHAALLSRVSPSKPPKRNGHTDRAWWWLGRRRRKRHLPQRLAWPLAWRAMAARSESKEGETHPGALGCRRGGGVAMTTT